MFTQDFVLNGQGHGSVAERLGGEARWDPGMLRPYLKWTNGRFVPTVTINSRKYKYNHKTGREEPYFIEVPIRKLQDRGMGTGVWNATTARKEDWSFIDKTVVMATRQRLTLSADLASAVPVGGFDAMSKLTYEYEAMADYGEAVVDMDAVNDGRHDEPLFRLRSVPLPIIHSDFMFTARRIAVSRNGTPLDTTSVEQGGRRIGEMEERIAVGTETGTTFGTQTAGTWAHQGTSRIYGLTNFTFRVTKTDLTTPLGTNPEAVMRDVIEMRETMYTNGFFGPFALYYSTSYDQWFDDDYFRSGSTAIQRTL